MPIRLNKILYDVSREKALYPNNQNATQEEVNAAWSRVGQKNSLSVHETRSIFKVLQKKYEQEKERGQSSWKLYDLMDSMHKVEVKEEPETQMEEDEEFEMLDVQDDEDNNSGGQETGEYSGRSSNCTNESPEKSDKVLASRVPTEEKKLLNSLVSTTTVRNSLSSNQTQQQQQKANIAAKAQSLLQNKGITLRKTQVTTTTSNNKLPQQFAEKKEKTTIQLPEAIKRKLTENLPGKEVKKINLGQKPATVAEELVPGTVITLPTNGAINSNNSSGTSATSATAANGFSTNLQEIDFSKDIIFDANPTELNGPKLLEATASNTQQAAEQLTSSPIFFKNLCNSSRHEAFGLYVANIMNRLSKPAASKLELQILRSVTKVLSEEVDDSA